MCHNGHSYAAWRGRGEIAIDFLVFIAFSYSDIKTHISMPTISWIAVNWKMTFKIYNYTVRPISIYITLDELHRTKTILYAWEPPNNNKKADASK